MAYLDTIRGIVSIAVPVLSVVLGILIGAWLTSRRETWQRRYAFQERQLREFYSPLLALRTEIRVKSELRIRMSGAADTVWRRLCAEARNTPNPAENLKKLEETRWPEFGGIIEYNNRQLADDIMPAYRRMLSVFRDNLWLADPETLPHLQKLVEFVDIWERWLTRTVPHEVVQNLGHSEASLHSFYDHVEKKHDGLRTRLSKGESA